MSDALACDVCGRDLATAPSQGVVLWSLDEGGKVQSIAVACAKDCHDTMEAKMRGVPVTRVHASDVGHVRWYHLETLRDEREGSSRMFAASTWSTAHARTLLGIAAAVQRTAQSPAPASKARR
jgi:hypothetical protein